MEIRVSCPREAQPQFIRQRMVGKDQLADRCAEESGNPRCARSASDTIDRRLLWTKLMNLILRATSVLERFYR